MTTIATINDANMTYVAAKDVSLRPWLKLPTGTLCRKLAELVALVEAVEKRAAAKLRRGLSDIDYQHYELAVEEFEQASGAIACVLLNRGADPEQVEALLNGQA